SATPTAVKSSAARLALIIDDCGYDADLARKFAALDFPLTMAVLPRLDHSGTAARLAHAGGKTVILHLPMEPQRYPEVDPGPGALLVDMSCDSIAENLAGDLATVPFADGVNNHMGSRLTCQEASMREVMKHLKDRHLFFVDSRTIAASIAYKIARDMGVPTVKRDVFLDNDADPAAIRAMLDKAVGLARRNGSAVAIGHARESTYQVLKADCPELIAKGIELVPVNRLVK
ncbi:divergent polysaccharide deacetylase family protein, partial [bacterium]|nr:divergent polysaccharide deacetylase family protein [candidate division CSSED10-310 bacterium]